MNIALVIPAAGVGARMQADRPKQYLVFNGKTVLEHTVDALVAALPAQPIYLALAEADPYFSRLPLAQMPNLHPVIGGKERADSVLAALLHINAEYYPWVLVHDAARPLVTAADIHQLMLHCEQAQHGGILACQVRDTMKRGDLHEPCQLVAHTVSRQHLWHALTPQLFPTVQLREALQAALASGVAITDEASAMEWAGHPVLLCPGRADNLKITQPEDLALARFYLEHA